MQWEKLKLLAIKLQGINGFIYITDIFYIKKRIMFLVNKRRVEVKLLAIKLRGINGLIYITDIFYILKRIRCLVKFLSIY